MVERRKYWRGDRIRLTVDLNELTVIRRALCLLHTVVHNLPVKFNEKHRQILNLLIRRLDRLPRQIFAGLKAAGYVFDEKQADAFIKSWQTHRRFDEAHWDDVSRIIDLIWRERRNS